MLMADDSSMAVVLTAADEGAQLASRKAIHFRASPLHFIFIWHSVPDEGACCSYGALMRGAALDARRRAAAYPVSKALDAHALTNGKAWQRMARNGKRWHKEWQR